MNSEIRYRIDPKVKSGYTKFIEDKYDHKHGKCGRSIERLMKLELALEGNELYRDDPDVLELLGKVRENLLHSHSSSDECVSLDEDEILQLKSLLKSVKSEDESPSSGRDSSMDMFANLFLETYKNSMQVSRKEIAMLASLKQGISDQRAIQNRITYLMAHDILEPCAPNVFNVKI